MHKYPKEVKYRPIDLFHSHAWFLSKNTLDYQIGIIENAINTNDANVLENALQKDYVHQVLSSTKEEKDHDGNLDVVYTQLQDCSHLIEVLFLEKHETFKRLFEKLLENNDEQCKKVFIEALNKTVLNSILILNVNKIVKALNEFEKYAKQKRDSTSTQERRTKYSYAVELVQTLTRKLNNFKTDVLENKKYGDTTKQIKTLKFKLDFVKELHENKGAVKLGQHLGWRQFTLNLVSAVFTGFIPYLFAVGIRGAVTGKWSLSLFNQKTTAVKKIEEVQNSLERNPEYSKAYK